MKRYPQPELHFDEKELKTDLGEGNFVFVGSSCDMFAKDIKREWIDRILAHCKMYRNEYLFQSKRPNGFYYLPIGSIIGTTIETNRHYQNIMGAAPIPLARYDAIIQKPQTKMVSIEPIMDFDLEVMVEWMREIKPNFVSIGADSGNNHLPEPPPEKVRTLIDSLRQFTEVKLKDNLKRLI